MGNKVSTTRVSGWIKESSQMLGPLGGSRLDPPANAGGTDLIICVMREICG